MLLAVTNKEAKNPSGFVICYLYMIEKLPTDTHEDSNESGLVMDLEKRALLVDALKVGAEEAWAMMGEMMDNLEAQIQGNSAEEMSGLFFAQAAIYFDAGLNDAGISALNDAHIYAHNMKSEELARTVREMITSRGGVILFEIN
jgi:hypothetical protein